MKLITSGIKFLTYLLFSFFLIVLSSCDKKDDEEPPEIINDDIVRDFDGKTYKTIKIGDQWWMAENLKSKHYADGTEIPIAESLIDWFYLEIEDKAFCYYANSPSNGHTYGYLYNWVGAMNGENSSSSNPSNVQGICPIGWHLPSKEEWVELIDHLDGIEVAGGKMKESGTEHWTEPNTGATNSSGFTSLPGGAREAGGVFTSSLFGQANFWTATQDENDQLSNRIVLNFNRVKVDISLADKNNGNTVRCVKDK